MNNQYEFNDKKQLINQLVNELPVLRAKLGASQADIADRIGISRQMLNSLETGKREMTWTTFVALIALFQNNEDTNNMLKNMDGFLRRVETELSVENRIAKNFER
ncbi:MAG: helix-turn-helix transcriptional regulator [Ruminococcus sp.]|nr:helix-turn-helix transcriptional regulator [Ruminococcus sp.]